MQDHLDAQLLEPERTESAVQQRLITSKRAQLLAERRRAVAERAMYQELWRTHLQLLRQGARASEQRQAALRELDQVLRETRAEATRQARLRGMLREVQDLGRPCQAKLGALREGPGITGTPWLGEGSQGPAGSGLSASSSAHFAIALPPSDLRSDQILVQVERAERAKAQAISELRKKMANLHGLGPRITASASRLQKELGVVSVHVQELSKSARENKGKIDHDLVSKSTLSVQVERLKRELSPVAFATIQAENEAYQAELARARRQLAAQRGAERRAVAAQRQREAEVEAQWQAASTAAGAVDLAEREGRRRLAAGVQEMEARQAEDAPVLKEFQNAVEANCTAHSAKRRHELRWCDTALSRLSAARAEAAAMERALRARQDASHALG